MKAYSYLRFSTPEQAQGDSFRRQTVLAEAYANANGLDLDTELRFADRGVSAFRGQNAATGALMLFRRAIEDGKIETPCFLLVESLDRISRNVITEAQGLFLSIIGMGVTLVTLTDRKEYSKASINENQFDLIMALLVMIRAHEESATKSKRLLQAWVGKRERVARGEVLLTSKAPGWLKVIDGRIEVLEDRAAVVRRIFALTLEGQGKEAVSRTLNEEGVPPFGRAGHWHTSYIQKVLANPAVIGTLTTSTVVHADGKTRREALETFPGYYPAVVDPETFARVQTLKTSTVKTKGAALVQNPLAGLAVCPLCSSRMTRVTKGSTSKAGKPYLVCSKAKGGAGCEYKTVRLDYVETIIRASYDEISEVLASYGSDGLAGELAKLEANAMGLEGLIEEVIDTLAEVGRSPALTKRLRGLETELDTLQREIKTKRSLLGTKSLAARLSDLKGALEGAVAAVNTALRELFASVVVDYQTGELVMQAHSGAVCRVRYQWVEA